MNKRSAVLMAGLLCTTALGYGSDAISVEVNGVRTHDKVPIPHECFYSDSDWSSRRPELQLGNGIVTRFRANVKPIAH